MRADLACGHRSMSVKRKHAKVLGSLWCSTCQKVSARISGPAVEHAAARQPSPRAVARLEEEEGWLAYLDKLWTPVPAQQGVPMDDDMLP